MKCQILLFRKNKKNIISLLSAESTHSMVSVNYLRENSSRHCKRMVEEEYFMIMQFFIISP